MSVPSRYRTGDFLIDLDAREIRNGGALVDLEAKVFDLIALLLAGRDRALSKRELNDALWGDRPVTDAALSQQLRKARRALGDDGDAQAVIRTVHGRGLRWVAPVTVDDGAADPAGPAPGTAEAPAAEAPARTPLSGPPDIPATDTGAITRRTRRRRGLVAVAALALAGAAVLALRLRQPVSPDGLPNAPQRVAVLPVVDATGEDTLAWTPSGLMGLMTSLLEQQGGIEVVPAQNVLAALPAGARTDSPRFAALRKSLGATHLVVAQLHRVGPILELDVQLVAAGNAERHETLHGSEPAALAVDAVARVRRWLDLQPVAAVNPEMPGGGDSFQMQVYARGLDAQLHGDTAAAKRYFSICLDHDPGLAWPRLGLAQAQARSGESAEARENATRVAAAAREVGDNELLVPALHLLASLAFFGGDLDQARTQLDEALRHVSAAEHPLAMVDLLVAYGSLEDERGNATKSRAYFENALKLARDSGNPRGEASVLINIASLDNAAGNAAGAATDLRAGLDAARMAGDAYLESSTLGNLGATEANQGRMRLAATLFKQGLALGRQRKDKTLQAQMVSQLIEVLIPFGRTASAQALAERLLDAGERTSNPIWQADARAALAELATRRDDWPRALDELEHARTLYASAGMTRNVGEILARTVETALRANDRSRAHQAAQAFRALADADSTGVQWRSWLPLIAAQLRAVDGDVDGAARDLAHALDDARGANGPAAQAGLFQLGRWQLALGRGTELLARPEWRPLLEQDPDAITLRVKALASTQRQDEADAEQHRLDVLLHASELDLGADEGPAF